MGNIDACVKQFDSPKSREHYQKLAYHVFDSLLVATETTRTYLEDQKKGKELYFTTESQAFLTFIETMVQYMFTLCIDPASGNDPRIWEKMKVFCSNFLSIQMLVLVWQRVIFESTNTLADYLYNLPEEEYKVFAELSPFDGLPMKREYTLQVLYDACCTDAGASKYKYVACTKLYGIFESWMRLLKVLQIPSGFTNKLILLEYVKSKNSALITLHISTSRNHRHFCANRQADKTTRRKGTFCGAYISSSEFDDICTIFRSYKMLPFRTYLAQSCFDFAS